LLAVAIAGCAAPTRDPTPPAEPQQQAEAPPREPEAAPGEEREAVARSTLAFGLDLYKRLSPTDRNLFFSPAGLSAAFGMVQAGARGETEAQIAQVLRWRLSRERLHPALGGLLRALPIDAEGRKLTVANALWVQQGYGLRPDYVSTLSTHYGARATSVDFENGAAAAAAAISAWAERNTNGRIRRLIGPADLRADTRLVLTNTIWFKADWLIPFNAGATHDGDFRVEGGPPQRTRFMRMRRDFRFLEGPGFRAAELPYRGEEMSMLVFLPTAGIDAFERDLDPERLESWIDSLRASERRHLDLLLPKLRLETRYDLPGTLSAMGMPIAFTNSADFTGMTDEERLKIDRAIHQTFLLIDEKGTEAAAATVISMVPVSVPPPAIPFHADRPFFFLIRDNRSGAVLFMGRIGAPPPQVG
jgi:serpin B